MYKISSEESEKRAITTQGAIHHLFPREEMCGLDPAVNNDAPGNFSNGELRQPRHHFYQPNSQ